VTIDVFSVWESQTDSIVAKTSMRDLMIDGGVRIKLHEVETMPSRLYCRSDAHSGSPVTTCMGAWTELPKILGEVIVPSSDGSIAPTECLTVLCFCQDCSSIFVWMFISLFGVTSSVA